MKPSEESKNTNELMQILSSAKTPEELQAYTETLNRNISAALLPILSPKSSGNESCLPPT